MNKHKQFIDTSLTPYKNALLQVFANNNNVVSNIEKKYKNALVILDNTSEPNFELYNSLLNTLINIRRQKITNNMLNRLQQTHREGPPQRTNFVLNSKKKYVSFLNGNLITVTPGRSTPPPRSSVKSYKSKLPSSFGRFTRRSSSGKFTPTSSVKSSFGRSSKLSKINE